MLPATSLIPIHDENPTRTFSWLTVVLIGANVAVFLLEPSFGQPPVPVDAASAAAFCSTAEFFHQWGMIPHEILNGRALDIDFSGCPAGTEVVGKSIYLSVLTSMFVHGGFLHLGGNMLFLWVFGNNIEDRLGKTRFILFYLLTGVAAALAHAFSNPASTVPTVGASGAVAGMLGAYLILFPRARITTIVPIFFLYIVKLPAMLVLVMWFGSQFLIGASQQFGGAGVAWMAHVGGFLAGMALIIPFGGRSGPPRRRRPSAPFPYN